MAELSTVSTQPDLTNYSSKEERATSGPHLDP